MAYCCLTSSQLKTALRFLGRTLEDTERGTIWFNWSCSGFSLHFRGKKLRACFIAISEEMTAPFEHEPVMLSPVIGVHVDGGELRRFKLTEARQWLTLFHGDEGEHSIEIRKLSENVMGKCGLCVLELEGSFLPPPPTPALHIEFVGDSITCAYGVEATEAGFRTENENSELGYSFLAANLLGSDYSAVCVTGCGLSDPLCFPHMKNRGMLSMYSCTDAPLDRHFNNPAPQPWDFSAHPNDAVVINLGTNDANEISMLGFTGEALGRFRNGYRELLEIVRRLNGPKAWIVCTLGSMDYYLWDDIRDVVAKYTEQTGDKRIICEKLGKLNPMTEGLGADGHPSANSHERMGREMAEILKRTLGIK